jgi:hypothetical protein
MQGFRSVSNKKVIKFKCVQAMKVEKVNQQSYIFKTESTVIRIFSPFPDKISTLCGHEMNQNAGTIREGYTDHHSNQTVSYTHHN